MRARMKFGPISQKCSHLLHGADYYPEQWVATPGIWDEDMRLMKLAGCNVVSVGVFAWAALEPAEGQFEFGWLDTIMDKLAANKVHALLATPSGAKPLWLSWKYPEVRRVNAAGVREPHGKRHNHCRTSPVYREKCRIINRKLAERYKDHPALFNPPAGALSGPLRKSNFLSVNPPAGALSGPLRKSNFLSVQ